MQSGKTLSAEYASYILRCVSNRFMHMREIAKYKFLNKKCIEDIAREEKVIAFFNKSLFQYDIPDEDSIELSRTLIRISKSIQHNYFYQWYLTPSLLLMEHDNTLNINHIRDSIKINDSLLINAIGDMKLNCSMQVDDWNLTTVPCNIFVNSITLSQVTEIIRRMTNNVSVN